MSNAWTIAKRDFRMYFRSPIGYTIVAAFLFLMGYMFFMILNAYAMQRFQYQNLNMGKQASLTEGVVKPLYQNMNMVLLFFLPFVTMRLFAEEKKNHTLEHLMTAPVTLTSIIAGKFISALLLVFVLLGATFFYPVILMIYGNPDVLPILTSLLGTLLLCMCYLSLGILFSSLSENQIIVGFLTFGAELLFWIISWAAFSAGPVWKELFEQLSLIHHLYSFLQGIVKWSDIVYYLSFSFFCLFLTHRVLDSYRWR